MKLLCKHIHAILAPKPSITKCNNEQFNYLTVYLLCQIIKILTTKLRNTYNALLNTTKPNLGVYHSKINELLDLCLVLATYHNKSVKIATQYLLPYTIIAYELEGEWGMQQWLLG